MLSQLFHALQMVTRISLNAHLTTVRWGLYANLIFKIQMCVFIYIIFLIIIWLIKKIKWSFSTVFLDIYCIRMKMSLVYEKMAFCEGGSLKYVNWIIMTTIWKSSKKNVAYGTDGAPELLLRQILYIHHISKCSK